MASIAMFYGMRSRCSVFSSIYKNNKIWLPSSHSPYQISNLQQTPQNKRTISTSSKCLDVAQHQGHNHSFLWTAERVVSAGLLGVLPLAFVFPNTPLDYVAALALTAHVHWGVEAIVVDYVRPSVVGKTMANVASASIYILSAFMLGGLFYFNYNDVGLMQAIRMLWKL